MERSIEQVLENLTQQAKVLGNDQLTRGIEKLRDVRLDELSPEDRSEYLESLLAYEELLVPYIKADQWLRKVEEELNLVA